MRTQAVAPRPSEKKRVQTTSVSDTLFTWWTLFGIIVVLSFGTRFYKVSEPDHVCWDETHFGKMASWYINRTFFFDVHPPLGKMLIALAGHLTGYNGSFPFEKPGDKYEDTNYVGMRMLCTFLGACIPPLGFLIVWELTFSDLSAFLSSYFLVADISLVTISQYILLDPILLFFEMFAFYAVSKFFRLKNRPFTRAWWTWLFTTGIMLACSVSVKFVGLFMVIHVGILTVFQLWEMIQNPTQPLVYTMKHFFARCLGLILLPVFLYTLIFYTHLSVLNKSGNGDGFYSSAFQSQLLGNSLHNASMPREVAYGAIVTLKNHRTGGGYLHSHWHLYPEGVGARQQQITTYTHKDDNNKWIIKQYHKSEEDGDKVKLVKNGDLIILEHVTTARNLHSHKEMAPISKKHLQVTGYGENGTGDANDVWKVQIVGGREGDIINTVTTQIRLLHSIQHCTLTSSGKQLPKWAYEQQEVSCNPNLRDKNGIWNVEDNIFDKLPNVSFEVYGPSFFERIIESHAVMLQGNAGLKPKEGEVTSRPWQWPLNYRGQFFSGNSYRIYLLGNPVVWWPNLIFLVVFLGFFCVTWVQAKRGYRTALHGGLLNRKLEGSSWLFLAWALHYFPFWAMGRVLYYHHYFPALLFNTMLSGIMISFLFDLLTQFTSRGSTFTQNIFHWAFGFILSIVSLSFIMFSPLSYGMSGPHANDPNSTMYGLKWLETWEF